MPRDRLGLSLENFEGVRVAGAWIGGIVGAIGFEVVQVEVYNVVRLLLALLCGGAGANLGYFLATIVAVALSYLIGSALMVGIVGGILGAC